MARISRQQMFMEAAKTVAKRSTCFRMNVGCVITANNRIVSIGYNGAPPGVPHCAGNSCPGVVPGSCPTVHAEVNALRHLPSSYDRFLLDLYVTLSPCEFCVAEMSHHLIKNLFFETAYRNTTALDALIEKGVSVYQVSPSGYTQDWKTKQVIDVGN